MVVLGEGLFLMSEVPLYGLFGLMGTPTLYGRADVVGDGRDLDCLHDRDNQA